MIESARPGSEELVLGFLAEAGDEFVSGEAISDKLGLSRAAVWKHVDALRAQGYRIDAVPARGYRLMEIPDRLGELELRPLLNTHDLGQVLHWFEEVGSTNDIAKRLADDGAAHGEVVVAEAQTAGRGRRGRVWASPTGRNLTFSIILRPDLPPSRASELTLVASVALCQAVRQAGVPAGIKWPNDLLVHGRKLAGILTELAADPDRVQWVVLGIGVNVNVRAEEFPAELRDIATSLAMERGEPVPRALFAAAVLSSLEEWLDRHAEDGFPPVREAWRAMSITLGREVRVRASDRDLEGVAEDVDEAGALLVRTPAGLERVLAGDVELLRPR
ncbi:MAG: biotin--[acetyl-CoA-carboxylase] ligase [Anaeromyxobacter sp. RBG_16_69_14]|nr:MAG: biotin--[acetyl-CoA-carboxylase] ligase [Anaeromyxobacter sp. RBG_16_69_14]